MLLNKKIKILITAGVVPIIILFWPSFLGGDTNYIITHGKSMLPTIQHGSMVITKEEPQYFVDDIVSFTQREDTAEKMIVHRIIEKVDDGGFIIQGDNNPEPDPGIIPSKDINGKVVVAIPYAGYGLEFLRNPLAMIVVAISMMALQSDLKRRKGKSNKKSDEKPKKQDFGIFYGAIALNILLYAIIQLSLSAQITPAVDMLTRFLMRMFLPSFASTLAFGLYFLGIIGIYYFVKAYRPKPSQKSKSTHGGVVLLKDTNAIMLAAQMFWIMFIMIGTINLIATVQDPAFVNLLEEILGVDIPINTESPKIPSVRQYG